MQGSTPGSSVSVGGGGRGLGQDGAGDRLVSRKRFGQRDSRCRGGLCLLSPRTERRLL